MNHESETNAHSEEPVDHAADLVDLINAAVTPLAGVRLAALYNERGAAAIAFARLPDTNLEDEHLSQSFSDAFLATYPDREECIREQLDGQGWLSAVNKQIDDVGIPDGFLVWNHDEVWRRLTDMYDIVEYGGQVYVFAR